MSQNIPSPIKTHRSKVWVYFKRCDVDPKKARCNLCSVELCYKGTTSILWDHVQVKHSIDKDTSNEDNKDSPSVLNMTPTKIRNNTKNIRQNLDLIDYNDFTLTSMKPLPSSSLSKNLISRLNQLSSPVTRKLKFWNKKSFQVNQYDPSFKVIYLGNLGMQLWSKDESCLDKPLSTLWNNYLVNMKTEIVMRLTICNSGLKAITRQHGLTQYWSNRLVYCCSHGNYPRIFSWIYRHEGKKMRQELRCHAVFCPSPEKATKMVTMLNQRLACALQEFRREKKSRGLTIAVSNNISSSSLHQNLPRTIPLRRQILAKGSANFRPPLERSKSAPKLTSILEEDFDSDDDHDEFEFEESFGDRDSDSDEGLMVKMNNEENMHNIESNSLKNTFNNEETSNNIPPGQSSLDQEKPNTHPNNNVNSNGVHVNFNEIRNRTLVEPSVDYKRNLGSGTNNHLLTTENSVTNQIDNSHNNQSIQRSSANTITTSSSFQEHLVANQDTKTKSNNSLTRHEAKNNNTSNKMETQPTDQADDISTQEIILSWSNFVIR